MAMSNSRVLLLVVGALCALAISVQSRALDDQTDLEVVHHLDKRARSKCMGDLGCFEITSDFFHPLYRPVNLLPSDREKINTKFLLHTRKNIKQEELIRQKNKKDIENSNFDPKKETKFIIHGFIDNQFFGAWMKDMMRELLMHGDYNIFLVDWSGGNTLPYTLSTANTRVVGAEIALFVKFLQENFGLKPENVHIMGHSLGAHVAGYAGEKIKNLGRITGMDPAEPYFQYLPESVRLDPSDAQFVDVIHTDSKTILKLGLGMSQLCGHVDFFPNDGNAHPGCSTEGGLKILTEGLIEGVRRFVACNHQRAVDFMMDSINDQTCQIMAYACPDFESYKEGRCSSCGVKGEGCAPMGINAIEYKPFVQPGKFVKLYTVTAPKSPFCTFQYQVTFKLQADIGKDRQGTLKLNIRGSKRSETFELGDGKMGLYPGASYSHLLATQKNLGDIEAVTFSWKRSTWVSGILIKHYIYLDQINVIPISVNEKLREELSRRFCAKSKGEIKSGDSITLLPTYSNEC